MKIEKSILITAQRDATQSSLFIILQVHSTCVGCQPHPSSGVHKTVTTASGTVQLPTSNVAKLHPTSAVHKTVTTASGTVQLPTSNVAKLHTTSAVHKTVTTASGTVQLPTSNVAKLHPTSAVHKTVTTAFGTGHIFVQLPPYNVAKLNCTKMWPVLEAVVTFLCIPDERCGWHPKHVEWTCRIINRLLCVASRWTIINIDQRCTEP